MKKNESKTNKTPNKTPPSKGNSSQQRVLYFFASSAMEQKQMVRLHFPPRANGKEAEEEEEAPAHGSRLEAFVTSFRAAMAAHTLALALLALLTPTTTTASVVLELPYATYTFASVAARFGPALGSQGYTVCVCPLSLSRSSSVCLPLGVSLASLLLLFRWAHRACWLPRCRSSPASPSRRAPPTAPRSWRSSR
jgi:hypothetical protein